VAVVAYLAIVGILGAAFFATVHRTMDGARAREYRAICEALANGGVERTLARLRIDSAYAGERETPLGEGSVTTSVQPAGPDTYRIVSTGQLDTRAKLTVEAEAVIAGGRVAALRRLGETAR
jgi:hypothetical protein